MCVCIDPYAHHQGKFTNTKLKPCKVCISAIKSFLFFCIFRVNENSILGNFEVKLRTGNNHKL